MRYSRSILNAFFVLALVPVAQASIYAMADGVNFNTLARQKAQKRTQQQHHYRDLVRNPFRLFKRQEDNPDTPIPTLPPISNTSTTTTAETTTDISSSITDLEPTSTDDDLSPTTSSTDAETTGPSETETTTDGITTTPSSSTELPASTDVTTTSEAPSTTTEDITSTTDTPSTETTTSLDEPASETSTEVTSSTETTTETETTTTIRTTLDTSVKSAFTTAWSTSTFTLPNGAVGTVTEYLVVVPTISPPTRAQNPQESETATGTASLHTNAAGLYTPGPVPVVAFMAVLGYVGGAAF